MATVNSPRYKALIGIGLSLMIAGCQPSSPAAETLTEAAVSVVPSPDSSQSVPTRQPLTEETPAIIIEPNTPIPTPLPPTPSIGVPLEELAILSPGPGSHLNSPIQVAGFGGPSAEDRVEVRLIGENGRLIAKGLAYLYVLPGNAGYFYANVPFVSELVAEQAWIEIRSFGERYGELRHLSSQEIILLTVGKERIYPDIRGAEQITIFRPRSNAIVEGGTVLVSGAGWVNDDHPLQIEIWDRFGNPVGSSEATVMSPEPGQLGAYQAEVTYETTTPQWARIVVYEIGPPQLPIRHLTSVEIWLNP
jgi:hypothetical protein